MRSIWAAAGLRKTKGRAAKPITKAFWRRVRRPQSSTPMTAEAVICVQSEVVIIGEVLLLDETDDGGGDEDGGGCLEW